MTRPALDIAVLRSVSGVGPTTITNLRQRGYSSLDSLMGISAPQLTAIPGIGRSTAESILDFLAKIDLESGYETVRDYRHDAKRANIPQAGLAAYGKTAPLPKQRYYYDPHLSPMLRFDDSGSADTAFDLIEAASTRPLSEAERSRLAAALRHQQPWLEWSGKREKQWFEVDPVALHLHERVSAQAIVKLAQRQPPQYSLFADPDLSYRDAIRFYQHEMDWANRLVLGDSALVMSSLAKRENVAGKVQMIYFDPPYGIKYRSNFQSRVNQTTNADLTREPEQVKAYRDTWQLGSHSYLAYLRDRLLLARELLHESGSLFVQISDENMHRVRSVMDEVFGYDNFCGLILYRRGGFQTTSGILPQTFDYILWFAKDQRQIKFNKLRVPLDADEWFSGQTKWVQEETGELSRFHQATDDHGKSLPVFSHRAAYSASGSEASRFPVKLNGREFFPPSGRGWSTNPQGFDRLTEANRLLGMGNSLRFLTSWQDFPYGFLSTGWTDTVTSGFGEDKVYVVQTASMIIERCLLMTTDPGDLVLDPTCGSGTTAYVAEKWGRRWITIDTSRVALAVTRQRLLTATYPYFRLKDEQRGIDGDLVYKITPHISLASIAHTQAIDPIAAKWNPILDAKLSDLNEALKKYATRELRTTLQRKYEQRGKTEGKRALTNADERRWLLPAECWEHWQVPFDTDPDWPEPLRKALTAYRTAWRSKMDEVNDAIVRSAPQETLVDQPEVVRDITRVSGPFTVEGVQPIEQSLNAETPIGGAPEELDTPDAFSSPEHDPQNAEAHHDRIIRLLRLDGVHYPDNKVRHFQRLDAISHSVLHAEGEWGGAEGSAPRRAAICIGPEYGNITAYQVEDAIRAASRGGYDDLVFAGFGMDAIAQGIIHDDQNPHIQLHDATIRPDIQMDDLLKDTPNTKIFTVSGDPRVKLYRTEDGEYKVEMQGVDVYDPVHNIIKPTQAEKVAAWFLDTDYNGWTFHITQAFFPDKNAWDKIKAALKSSAASDVFEAFSGTVSLPFPVGKFRRVAVKVIDPYGNELMRVIPLEKQDV